MYRRNRIFSKQTHIYVAIAVTFLLTSPLWSEGLPKDTALLVIDIQNFYFPGGRMALVEPGAAALKAQALLDKFRETGRPVVHVRHNFEPGGEIHALVKPQDWEKVISKDQANAYKNTDLLAHLKQLKINTVVICGMQTHMCVEAAVRASRDLDFQVIIVHDACATRALAFAGREVSAADVHASTLSALSGSYAEIVDTQTLLERFRP